MIRDATQDDAARVVNILRAAGLDDEFVAHEFVVAEEHGRVVGCARLKRLEGGAALELASVAVVRSLRGSGLGSRLTRAALARANGAPVLGLALAPDFFSRFGFERLDAVPPPLRAKAEGACSSRAVVPMLRPGGDA